MTKYIEYRTRLIEVLKRIGIAEKNIFLKKSVIPREYPAAIISHSSEAGKHRTGTRYLGVEFYPDVYLMVDINRLDDPDSIVSDLSESFCDEYQKEFKLGVPSVNYYYARAESNREVKIIKPEFSEQGRG